MIDNVLDTRTIATPIANHDYHQHAFDENLPLQNLWDAIALMAALLAVCSVSASAQRWVILLRARSEAGPGELREQLASTCRSRIRCQTATGSWTRSLQ